jgi:hypothetical protein
VALPLGSGPAGKAPPSTDLGIYAHAAIVSTGARRYGSLEEAVGAAVALLDELSEEETGKLRAYVTEGLVRDGGGVIDAGSRRRTARGRRAVPPCAPRAEKQVLDGREVSRDGVALCRSCAEGACYAPLG